MYSNKAKFLYCLACMLIYGVIYAKFIKHPLLSNIAGLPTTLQQMIIIIVIYGPLAFLGAYAIHYSSKDRQAAKKNMNR
jgi:hypothetical protein